MYNLCWNSFCTWCSARRISPWHATVQQVAAFLHNLYQQCKLKVRTIKGYKLAIAATLNATGVNVGTDPHSCGIISSFYTDRPVEPNLVLRWDFAVVQGGFSSVIGVWDQMRNTRFRWSSDGKDVFLRLYVGFMAKTHVARDPSTTLTGFKIKSLAATLDRSA